MSSLSTLIERDAIRQDLYFYLDLLSNLDRRCASSVLILGIMPYVSLFVVESFKYLRLKFPDYARSVLGSHEGIIRAARMRVKYFDDSKKQIDGVFALYEWIVRFHREWHINRQTGFLGWLKKKIQSDFGIFEYEGHIVAATHVGILNLGLEMEDLPNTSKEISEALSNLVFSVGHQIGLYLGHISQLPEFAMAEPVTAFDYRLRDTLLRYRDENAQRFLAKIFEGAGLEDLNFSLLVFLIAINYLVYLVSNVVRYSPTVFKMRYLALYHIVSSLKKLQSYYYSRGDLSSRSKRFFGEMLSNKTLQFYTGKRKFRNILVHYGLEGEVPDTILDSGKTLYGLVEHFFNGESFAIVSYRLDEQLKALSALLEEWLGWQVSHYRFYSLC